MILYYKILLTLIIKLQPLNIKKIHINLTTNINLFKKNYCYFKIIFTFNIIIYKLVEKLK